MECELRAWDCAFAVGVACRESREPHTRSGELQRGSFALDTHEAGYAVYAMIVAKLLQDKDLTPTRNKYSGLSIPVCSVRRV